MIRLYLEKLYRYPRVMEPMGVGIPVEKGRLKEADKVRVMDDGVLLPSQSKVTSRYEDGSVRFLFTRFQGTLPGNCGKEFQLYLDGADEKENAAGAAGGKAECGAEQGGSVKTPSVTTVRQKEYIRVSTGTLDFAVRDYSDNIFEELDYQGRHFVKEQFVGPVLRDGHGAEYGIHIDRWSIIEEGPVCTVLSAEGYNESEGGGCEESAHYRFELRITAYAGKSWLDLGYRIFNTSEQPVTLASLVFALKGEKDGALDFCLRREESVSTVDSTGCGDMNIDLAGESGPVYKTRGIKDLPAIEKLAPAERIRTCAGSSNYRTDFLVGRDGEEVHKTAYDQALLMEGNEHMSEVLYGTLFADRTQEEYGVCATIYQAQQNYPKAVKADASGVYVFLVPEGFNKVVMQPGMAREQRFQLYFHGAKESLAEIDNRSLIYQMPDRPVIEPEVYRRSGAMTDVFADRPSPELEMTLIGKGDAHSRSFGMLNWGDSIDQNYTRQGRGGGEPVWVNNEYDYPHACALMYARSGIRRFLDYCLVHSSHWMDVDVCHYSSDPQRIGGQIEHTKGHVINGVLVPSHQWVEGLLDYYHFTGDERGLKTAIGIGDNVLRLLDTPAYRISGESSARETGWALRTLTALYAETGDEKWKEKCGWIVGHFKEWQQEYGCFLAPYTDNTLVRVGFMISVAVGSLMRYYRVEPSEELRSLILSAVDDILDNCRLDCGLFYYKELPSLARLGNNSLLLEAMAVGYELTGDRKYLEAGLPTYRRILDEPHKYVSGEKKIIGDALVYGGDSTKNFAQSFYPLAYYYKCLVDAGMK